MMSKTEVYYAPPEFYNYMTLSEAARFYGYSVSHLRLLCDTGAVLGRKSGSHWIVYGPSVQHYLFIRGV